MVKIEISKKNTILSIGLICFNIVRYAESTAFRAKLYRFSVGNFSIKLFFLKKTILLTLTPLSQT